jgi:conjugative relaxase-like TrwC/TraI family protein
MAKIAKLSAGKAKDYYYEKDPIMNPGGEGENLKVQGVLAEGLGLTEGENLSEEQLENVLKGYTADGETQLLNRIESSSTGKENAAFDFVCSAPKSVSMLALTVDDRLIEAHEKANQKVLDYVHENYGQVYEKVDGKTTIKDGGGMLSASAQHSIARDQIKGVEDPHLHTHNLIFNIGFDKEKETFKALAAGKLLKDTNMLNDMYRSELAKNVKDLGYEIELHNENGSTAWDIAGVDREEILHFSQRHNSIEGDTLLEREESQHNNKKDKSDLTAEELVKDWKEQQTENFQRSFEEIKEDALSQEKREPKFDNAMQVLEHAAKGLSDNEVLIEEKKLLKLGSTMAMGEFTQNELREALHSVKKIGQTEEDQLKLIESEGKSYYTTKNLYDKERDNIYLVKNQGKSENLLSKEQALEEIQKFNDKQEGWNLSAGQSLAVERMLTNDKENLIINGNAGVGKTTLMEAFKEGVQNNHSEVEIIALAPTGAAAKEIQEASGIKSMTVDSFLMQVDNGLLEKEKFSGKRIEILVDEAGMLGGEKANKLLHIAKDHDADVHTTWVGDTKQFKSVQNMDFFKDAQRYVETIDITQSNRFKNETTQTVADLVNAGKTDEALQFLSDKGHVKEVDLEGKNEKLSNEIKEALSNVELVERSSNNIPEDKILEKLKDVAAERNELQQANKADAKNADIEQNYRDKQKEFFNLQIVARDGFNEQAVRDYAAQHMDKENGNLFVENSIENANKLKEAGILNENGSFVDDKAKEILFEFSDKSNEAIAKENLKSYSENSVVNSEIFSQFKEKEKEKIYEKKDDEPKLTRAEQLAKEAVNETNGDKNVPILAAKNATIDAINKEARERHGLTQQEQLSTTVLRTKEGFNDLNKRVVAANYDKGDIVQNSTIVKGMRAHADYKVVDVDTKQNKVIMETEYTTKHGEIKTHRAEIDAKELIKASVSQEEKKDFTNGDKIVFLRNSKKFTDKDTGKKFEIKNGNVGDVVATDKDKNMITVDIGGKHKVDVYLNEYKNVNHGFGLTFNKSQGGTYDKVVAVFDSKDVKMNSKNLSLVGFTRAKHEISVVTDKVKTVKKQIMNEQVKTTTLDKNDLVVEDKAQNIKDMNTVKEDKLTDDQRAAKIPLDDAKIGKVEDNKEAVQQEPVKQKEQVFTM